MCTQELLPDSSFCVLPYVRRYSDTIVHNRNAINLINICIVNYFLQKTGIQPLLRNYSGEMIDNRYIMTKSIHYTVKTISKVSSSVVLETPRKKCEWSELIYCEE